MTSDMAQVNDIISRILLSLKSPTFTNEMSRNQNIFLIVGANIHIYTLRGLCLILTTSDKLGCFKFRLINFVEVRNKTMLFTPVLVLSGATLFRF